MPVMPIAWTRSRLPVAVTVAVALVDPARIARAMCGAGQALDIELHQTLGGKAHHLAQQIGIGTLLQQSAQVHHVFGHRRVLWFAWTFGDQTLPRSAMTTAV